jgi:tetratricopeptide (TPR) repeat protein
VRWGSEPGPARTGLGRRRAAAAISLATALIIVGALVSAGDSGPQAPRVALHSARTHPIAVTGLLHRHAALAHKPPKPPPATTSTTSTTPPPTTPASLEARGHQLMVNGSYADAIPVLRQAVDAASPSSLTFAYALFDLGRSLRLAGDPQAAIPILWRRLQIPNQTDVVRQELQLALLAVGSAQRGGDHGGGPPGQGKHDHGQGGGNQQQD